MRFAQTPLAGVLVVEDAQASDARGAFARLYDREAFAARGLPVDFPQVSLSSNRRAGTLRGMHFQDDPHGETKLVRCVRGAVFDVALDLRPQSPTRGRWYGVELRPEAGRSLLVPPGCAHGFQTLADDSDVLYLITPEFVPGAGRGVRWDDPRFAIGWPAAPPGGRIMSEADRSGWALVDW